MRSSILLVILVSCGSFSAFGAEKPASAEAIALGLINDAAIDSWAEAGDVQRIGFTRLQCQLEVAQCDLTYKVKVAKKPFRTGTCSLTGVTGYDDLIQIVKYGFVLKNGIFEQIDACMTASRI